MHIMHDMCPEGFSKNAFFEHMLRESFDGNSENLLKYFSAKKYEKEEYLSFLETLLSLLLESKTYSPMLEKLPDDIQAIKKNNVSARYIVDQYIWEIVEYA